MWLTVPHDVVASVDEADLESLVSHLQGVREAEVAVLVKEIRQGECAVSLRSRGGDGVDVSAVASTLGGGGHPAAAGCTVSGDPGLVTARLSELLA